MIFWLNFRLKQVARLIMASGILILLVAVLLSIGFWARILNWMEQGRPIHWLAGGIIVIGLLHAYRSDHRFLAQGRISIWQLCCVDYFLLLCPLVLITILLGHGAAALLWFSGLAWCVMPPGTMVRVRKTRLYPDLKWLPVHSIEWLYIWRSQKAVLMVAQACFVLIAAVHPGFFIAGTLLIWVSLLSAFEHIEPAALLPTDRRSAMHRWRQCAWLTHAFLLVGYILVGFHGYMYLALAAYILIATEALLFLAFALKWASWYPGRRRMHNPISLSLAMFFCFLPGFIIVVWAQGVFYARRALNTLQLK